MSKERHPEKMTTSRQYDIVLLGATGYTAGYVAEYIMTASLSNLHWAIAGRDANKLERLRGKLAELDSSGSKPAIELVNINLDDDLSTLVSRTKVLINAIGPYTCHGEPVLSACAENGTSYVDFCTETPWLEEMITKYSKIAKRRSARIVPAIGNSSSPSSLVAYLLAKRYHETHKKAVENITCSYSLKINGMSAGSLSSVLKVVERYGVGPLLFPNPYRLCSSRENPSRPEPKKGLFLGHHRDELLGHLTTSLASPGNEAVVYRSQKLQPSIYGGDGEEGKTIPWSYREFMPASSTGSAIMIHVVTKILVFLLFFRPVCALISLLKPVNGTGPSKEDSQNEKIEVKAVTGNDHKLMARYSFNGSMYFHSAMLAAEAAMVLLSIWDVDEQWTDDVGYGVLTPSCLGMPFVERLKKAGVDIEVYTS
ncbi:hypothetical protein LTS17_006927 [Exophiala oligosperma]